MTNKNPIQNLSPGLIGVLIGCALLSFGVIYLTHSESNILLPHNWTTISEKSVESTDIGTAVFADFHFSGRGHEVKATTLFTTERTIPVLYGFHPIHGNLITIERMENGNEWMCDRAQDVCHPVLR